MERPVLISIAGTQRIPDERPETIELVTQGRYRYEPGLATISYTESELTGLCGVQSVFTIDENAKKAVLCRTGPLNSTMTFVVGQTDESLYDMGFGGLLIRVCTTRMTTLFNERGGIFDLEYTIEIEGSVSGTNSYHIEVRPLNGAAG